MTNNDRRTIKNVEIPRGMFVEISSILKGESISIKRTVWCFLCLLYENGDAWAYQSCP